MISELNTEQLNNPHFILFPTVTDRTAWADFGLPAILVVPHSLDLNGKVISGSEVQSVRILIETASSRAPVVGHMNQGVYIPNENIYVKVLNMPDVISRRIIPGTVTDNKFEYTTRTGIISTIDYISHATYFDISDITIETETLPPARYIMVYESTFAYRRMSKTTRELICIDSSDVRTSRLTLTINHPGEVIRRIVDITPALYFTSANRSQDTTIAFYRPIMEVLQDVYDEQNFLEEINWVYNIQPQYIPYVSYLLGWELPFAPQNIRQLILKNVVKLQKLKGTKRAIHELFGLFSVVANVTNVWWTPDGAEFIGVNEPSKNGGYTVELQPTATTEPILYDYSTSGWGIITAPLINRPSNWDINKERSVVIRAILVETNSDAYDMLSTWPVAIGELDYSINKFTGTVLPTTEDPSTSPIESSANASGFLGNSTILIDNLGNSTLVDSVGTTPISSAKFDYILNSVSFNFDSNIEFKNTTIFVFATYGFDKVTVPGVMEDLQSNRFDVTIFNPDTENIDLVLLPFMMNFLFKVKAFHSLLRKVIFTYTSSEVYQVTDYCFGGTYSQNPSSDLGKQQVPPETIIPGESSECIMDPLDLGYRKQDIRYRQTIMDRLLEEFNAWRALGDDCSMNKYGQDRILGSDVRVQQRNIDHGNIYHSDVDRTTLCDLDGRDYCYKGRVADTLINRHIIPLNEVWKFGNGCFLGMGAGVYYDFTTNSVTNLYFDNVNKFNDNGNIAKHLAVQKPSLGIQKYSMVMPGHRLISMNNLTSDFMHETYKLRPWDVEIVCECGIPTPTWLNAKLSVGTDGDEYLTYDNTTYTVIGNNMSPDVTSMSDHSLGSSSDLVADDVVHTIYSSYVSGHEAITFDTLDDVPTGIEFVSTTDPIFASNAICGTGDYNDYIDGYPSTYGYMGGIDYDIDYFPSVSGSESEELEIGLGIPEENVSFTALFTMSSFIRDNSPKYAGYRLDCGCLQVECGGTAEQDITCTISNFVDANGHFDFNPDRLELEATAKFDESIRAVALSMNRLDLILFQLNQLDGVVSEHGYPVSDPFTSDGSFKYRDSYGVIYETSWQIHTSYLDVVVQVKDPRVWGVPQNGRVENHNVYIDGTITTTRDVFKFDGEVWVLVASGFESENGEFQWTYVCQNPFIDPFTYKSDHEVDDAFSFSTDDGHSFTTYGRETATVTHADSVSVLDFLESLFGSGA